MGFNINNIEKSILKILWKQENITVKEIKKLMISPKISFATLNFTLRSLEFKGFIKHIKLRNTYLYSHLLTKDDFLIDVMNEMIDEYFQSDHHALISFLKRYKGASKEI